LTFKELLEAKRENNEDPAVTIIKGANSMGGTFATDNADLLYLARNLIATYGAEPMKYKGALGWTKVCLQFIETGTKYKRANPSNKNVKKYLKDFDLVFGCLCYY